MALRGEIFALASYLATDQKEINAGVWPTIVVERAHTVAEVNVADGPAPKVVAPGEIQATMCTYVSAFVCDRQAANEAQTAPYGDDISTPDRHVTFIALRAVPAAANDFPAVKAVARERRDPDVGIIQAGAADADAGAHVHP